jgi:hypothetical protein
VGSFFGGVKGGVDAWVFGVSICVLQWLSPPPIESGLVGVLCLLACGIDAELEDRTGSNVHGNGVLAHFNIVSDGVESSNFECFFDWWVFP